MKFLIFLFFTMYAAGQSYACPMIQGTYFCESEISAFKMNIVQKNVTFRFFDRNTDVTKISSFHSDGNLRQFKNHYSDANFYKSSCRGNVLEIDILETRENDSIVLRKYSFYREDSGLVIKKIDQDDNEETILCYPDN